MTNINTNDIEQELVEILKSRILLEYPVISSIIYKIDVLNFSQEEYLIKYSINNNGFSIGTRFTELFHSDKKAALTIFVTAIATIGLGLYSKDFISKHGFLAETILIEETNYSSYDLLIDVLSINLVVRTAATANARGGMTTLFEITNDVKSALTSITALSASYNDPDDDIQNIVSALKDNPVSTLKDIAEKLYNKDIIKIDPISILTIFHMPTASALDVIKVFKQSKFKENVKFEKQQIEENEEEPDVYEHDEINCDESIPEHSASRNEDYVSYVGCDDEGDLEDEAVIFLEDEEEDAGILTESCATLITLLNYLDSASEIVNTTSYSPMKRFSTAFIKKTTFNYKLELGSKIDDIFKNEYTTKKLFKPGLQRNVVLPGVDGNKPRIAFFIDASGSVTNKNIKDAVSVATAVVENHLSYLVTFNAFTSNVREERVIIESPDIPDDFIQQILELNNISGGTSFECPFIYLEGLIEEDEENLPDLVIILSPDGEGYFPSEETMMGIPTLFLFEDTASTRTIANSYSHLGEFLFYPKNH